jgi:uncharacterized protein YehS (DUF1456 family)
LTNNDVLRRLRYALDLNDDQMAKIFKLGGEELSRPDIRGLLARDGDDDEIACDDRQVAIFLDGLVLQRRGAPKPGMPSIPPPTDELTNNEILKKLRIALTLRENDVLQILVLGGHRMSKSELSALFRKPNHRHFRPAGNQVLRKFLVGLTQHLRPDEGGPTGSQSGHG